MKRILGFLLLSTFSFISCQKSDFSGSETNQIEQYLEANNLTATEKTSSGLVYILTTANPSGEALQIEDYVTVNYAGRFLSDKEFDSGTFGFFLGVGRVVKGFDEGIAKMRVGEKATILFPSSLGYGNVKQGSIPKNSTLIFDIEVLAVE